GSKSPKVVQLFARQDASFLYDKGVKSIIIACNTASAEAFDILRDNFDIPVIGVINPGARAASESTKNGKIGVIGTHGTISSGAYKKAIQDIDKSIEVTAAACPLFVPLVEEGWESKSTTRDIAREYLSPLIEGGIDTLILGCTHYPILKPVLQEIVGDKIILVDSAEATAGELKQIFDEQGLGNSSQENTDKHSFYVSDFPFKFKEMAERFLGKELAEVELVPLEVIESHATN
ncbi:MAG: glutamate racemase, partial [Candidatus Marinimicrobia bacterium]|nr:glutamate racemase [Candidatus Neomarinimicrobiota bacterium]